jgi:transcription initiation factor IIE alpha subunit
MRKIESSTRGSWELNYKRYYMRCPNCKGKLIKSKEFKGEYACPTCHEYISNYMKKTLKDKLKDKLKKLWKKKKK